MNSLGSLSLTVHSYVQVQECFFHDIYREHFLLA